jgi:hypothetical protein
MRAKVIEQAIIADRRLKQQAAKPKPTMVRADEGGFDPFKATRWRVVAGGDPGYLVATSMTRLSGGFGTPQKRKPEPS